MFFSPLIATSNISSAVIVIDAPSNDVAVLRPHMSEVLAAVSKAKPGMVTHIQR